MQGVEPPSAVGVLPPIFQSVRECCRTAAKHNIHIGMPDGRRTLSRTSASGQQRSVTCLDSGRPLERLLIGNNLGGTRPRPVKRRCCPISREAVVRTGIDTPAAGPLDVSMDSRSPAPCDLKSSGVTARMPPSAHEYQ